MSNVAEIRRRIASGEIKPSTGGNSGPKVGEGLFEVIAVEADYKKGESGNHRGAVKFKVLGGGTDAEVGGTFNVYLQSTNVKYTEQQIAEWSGYLTAAGVNEDKIYDDADDVGDILGNIMTLASKQIARAEKGASAPLKFLLQRKEQPGTDAKGPKRYYNDIQSQISEIVEAAAPAAEDAVAVETGVSTPVVNETKKKPWAK